METGRDAHGIKSLNRHTLEQIVAACPAPVLLVDARRGELPVVYVNPAYERLTGHSLAELAGRAWGGLGRAAEGGGALASLNAAIGRAEACRGTIPALCKDGTVIVSDVDVTPLRDANGELKYFCVSYEPSAARGPSELADPTATDTSGQLSLLQREPGRSRHKVSTPDRLDPATGLVRFSHFQETLRRDLAMARRDRRFVTLLVFEIVEFDVYRQTFGDKAADSGQRMIGAQIMRALRREGDLAARYDDGTLVAAVIGQHASEVEPLGKRIAESVRQLKLHNPRAKSSRYIETRVSVIGCPPGAHDDPEPLIARALAAAREADEGARVVRA